MTVQKTHVNKMPSKDLNRRKKSRNKTPAFITTYLIFVFCTGIVCYFKLEDMTKLVSSQVVRKDNKYVVQKYMGKSLGNGY